MSKKASLWATHGATILGITLVLFMLGLLLCIEYHSYRITHDAQERITYKVDLTPDVSDSQAKALKAEIAKMPVVKHVDYISKKQAAEIFTQELNEDFVDFAGYNPLYPSLMVNFNVSLLPDNSNEVLDRFCEEVGAEEGVTGVAYQENLVNEVRDGFYKLSWFLIALMLVLVLITVVLIDSLLRIALYAQRETIHTMRMVGANVSFIKRPFIVRSVAYGALGGLIASLLTFAAVWVAGNEFQIPLTDASHLQWYLLIAVILIVVGILISYLSTAITVRRYIART